MTRQQRVVPIFVMVILAVAIGYSLIPFNFANAIDCGAPLLGAHAKLDKPRNYQELRSQQTTLSKGYIKPEIDCREKGKSRLAVSAVASLVTVMAGTAMVALKPESKECLAGNHDDCSEWWAGAAGSVGAAMSCQCACHTDDGW